ncbi:arsenate reductase family protein [Paenibacillus sp. YN15]|uniref:arsenate reductase family protein n=1 Tax=Paenibacillus sp. YN15 TaxID=1742774 RepID=UPI000DCC3AE6|nr:arsenate reductase family protein [Paenibacillus sp. YN15]RAU97609.1 arsenate reductase family protein [Paenibacillus sp. YN15]
MAVTFYGYPPCGTCRNALKWLKSHGVDVEVKDITAEPPGKEELKTLARLAGLDIRKLFNVSGQVYRELSLKDRLPDMSEEEMLELLAGNGKLIKRPVVTDGAKATVGFKEEEFRQAWA